MSAPRSVDDIITREERRREEDAQDAWDRLYAEWLRNRADQASPDLDQSDAARNARDDRAEELVRLLTTAPFSSTAQIVTKIELLEHYLGAHPDGCTAWHDSREFIMLAGIKADLFMLKQRR